MDVLPLFQLFSFVPVLLFGGMFWLERVLRAGAHKRTNYLLASLVTLAVVGGVQTLAWVVREAVPLAWPQLFVVSGLLYFVVLFFLECAIHVKRIDESYLSREFYRGVIGLGLWFGLAVVVAVLVLLAYGQPLRWVLVLFTLFLGVAQVWAARGVFNLQEGVIRRREYPFYFQLAVTLVVLGIVVTGPSSAGPNRGWFLPIGWFGILNLVYIARLVEEFFFWSQYNLRSDGARVELRQHTQNVLIRRVIGASDDDDRAVVRELMDAALEKAQGRMVVGEYRMTGLAAYRAVGSILKIEDPSHVVGYCTPLTDSKIVKSLDKQKLNEQILRTTYDLDELAKGPAEEGKDYGKRLIHQALVSLKPVVSSDLPDGLKGLQRLVVVVPIGDGPTVRGVLTVFKDSFDRLYPAEREVLADLAESLATVYALRTGKDLQRERLRLQGELNTARTIQTSILPRNPVVPGFAVGTYMETATEVGGDVFDFIPRPEGTWFGIGDVAGHGLPAGMMAVISVAAFHGLLDASQSLGRALSLDQVYDGVNRVLCTLNRDRIGSDKFMTQNYFFVEGNRVGHVGTHLVAAVWRNATQTVEELTALTNKTGFLGLSERMPSVQSVGEFVMNPGDVLVLYSDGVTEAKNANGTFYGLGRVEDVLATHSDRSPDELIAAVIDDLKRFAAAGDLKKNGGRFTDDVSLVVLKKL